MYGTYTQMSTCTSLKKSSKIYFQNTDFGNNTEPNVGLCKHDQISYIITTAITNITVYI